MVLIINENFMNYLQVAGAVVSAKWNAVIGQLFMFGFSKYGLFGDLDRH